MSSTDPQQRQQQYAMSPEDVVLDSYIASKKLPPDQAAMVRQMILSGRGRQEDNDALERLRKYSETLGAMNNVIAAAPKGVEDQARAYAMQQLARAHPGNDFSGGSGRRGFMDMDVNELAARKQVMDAIFGNKETEELKKRIDNFEKEPPAWMKAYMEQLNPILQHYAKGRQQQQQGYGGGMMDPIVQDGSGNGPTTLYGQLAERQKRHLDEMNQYRIMNNLPPFRNFAEMMSGGASAVGPAVDKGTAIEQAQALLKKEGFRVKGPMSSEELLAEFAKVKEDLENQYNAALEQIQTETEATVREKLSMESTTIKTAISAVMSIIKGIVQSNGGMSKGLDSIESMFNQMGGSGAAPTAQQVIDAAAEAGVTQVQQ